MKIKPYQKQEVIIDPVWVVIENNRSEKSVEYS